MGAGGGGRRWWCGGQAAAAAEGRGWVARHQPLTSLDKVGHCGGGGADVPRLRSKEGIHPSTHPSVCPSIYPCEAAGRPQDRLVHARSFKLVQVPSFLVGFTPVRLTLSYLHFEGPDTESHTTRFLYLSPRARHGHDAEEHDKSALHFASGSTRTAGAGGAPVTCSDDASEASRPRHKYPPPRRWSGRTIRSELAGQRPRCMPVCFLAEPASAAVVAPPSGNLSNQGSPTSKWQLLATADRGTSADQHLSKAESCCRSVDCTL